MNKKQLFELLQKNHLTATGLTIYLQCSEETLHELMKEVAPLPKAATSSLEELDARFTILERFALDLALKSKSTKILLVRYLNEEDFFEYVDDFPLFRTVHIHWSLLNRIVHTLNASGFTAYQVDFDAYSYRVWLTQQRRANSSSSRSEWGALQRIEP